MQDEKRQRRQNVIEQKWRSVVVVMGDLIAGKTSSELNHGNDDWNTPAAAAASGAAAAARHNTTEIGND